MESKIVFLGTGAGSAVNQQIRASGGILFLTGGYQFLLDPGPGSLALCAKAGVAIRQTTAVLVSHGHNMHCADVNAILAAMTHHGLDRMGVLISGESFVKGSEGVTPLLIPSYGSFVERVITPKPGQKIGIEHVEIHALATHHNDTTALGFKLFTPDFVLSYTGDTGYTKEVVEQYEESDILILNMPTIEKKNEFNLYRESVVKILKKIQPRLAILTHFSTKVLNEDPLSIAREIQHETEVQTIVARDGLLISPQSYSAGLQHKTLNLFSTKSSQEQSQNPQDTLVLKTASRGNTDLPFL